MGKDKSKKQFLTQIIQMKSDKYKNRNINTEPQGSKRYTDST